MEVVFLLSAERDLQEAYNWVEEHRHGREQYFLQDVDSRRLSISKCFLLLRGFIGADTAVCSSRDTLLVSSMLSNQTGLLFMRFSISAKIPKRSDSDFPNREYSTLISLLADLMRLEH